MKEDQRISKYKKKNYSTKLMSQEKKQEQSPQPDRDIEMSTLDIKSKINNKGLMQIGKIPF